MRGDVHFRIEEGELVLFRTTRSAKGQKLGVKGSQATIDLKSPTLKEDLIEYLEKPGTKR